MKIHHVTMTGFGPFRGTESVDFDAFDDDGIFLITGKTGAGKTSILDAVTYALFGSIPRYDGSAGEQVRSDHLAPTDPCEVSVVFSVGPDRWRVTRRPAFERPKQRGTGTTTVPMAVEVARFASDAWEVVETRTGNAELHISDIVKLNAKQFQQVILLAQGQFQEFLVAGSDKRRELLRMLFGTKRFSDYTDVLTSRATELRVQLAKSTTTLETLAGQLAQVAGLDAVPGDVDVASGAGLGEWTSSLVADHGTRVASAEAAATDTATLLATATTAFEQARSLAERQRRRADALTQQQTLLAQADAIAADRVRLADARRAELVCHAVELAEKAIIHHDFAVELHEKAELRFREVSPDADPTDLPAVIDALVGESATLGRAATLEAGLEVSAKKVLDAEWAIGAIDQTLEESRARRQALKAQQVEAESGLAALEEAAALLPEAQQTFDAVSARLFAATKAAATLDDLAEARRLALAAGEAATEASSRRDVLRKRQWADHAGVLAAELQDGEPCLVCGSTAHPAPAALADDHVDEADLEAADAAYERAFAASKDADGTVTRLTERLAEEQRLADGTVDELELQVRAAMAARDAARSAGQQLKAAGVATQKRLAEIEDVTTRIEAAQTERAGLVAKVATVTAAHAEAEKVVLAARGRHDSVASRLADLSGQLSVARTLHEAQTGLNAAREAVAATSAGLARKLEEHQFADVEAVDAARLPAHEQEALTERVADHVAGLAGAEAVLADPNLADLPAEPVDQDAPRAAFDEARLAHEAAQKAHTAAATTRTHVADTVGKIDAQLSAAGEVLAKYAVVDRLAATLRGQGPNTRRMLLESFALAAELEDIAKAANVRLAQMTGNRYSFQHSDERAKGNAQSGLALELLDAHTGEARPPQSLSGGEKFQASLALALGLAEVVTSRNGGMRLDTLFIDEGFGSLDPETLETTMATLDSLRTGNRTIGLISHVEAMKESIPAQLYVDKTDGGWSTIRTAS